MKRKPGPKPKPDRSSVVETVSSFKLSTSDRVVLARVVGAMVEEKRAAGDVDSKVSLGECLRRLIHEEAKRRGIE